MAGRQSDVILSRLLSLHPKVIDLGLDRTYDMLARLGNPQEKLPPVVHLAGTNGKGSTQAIMRAILEAAGYKVHAYTSPHLVKFHERIRLAGELISEDKLQDLLTYCEEQNDGEPITFFEITTAAAFKAFADNPADVVLLETGLGGRLDSTNVVENPAVTVLTPISMDHTQFLGNTIEAIAGEKAAIQKPSAISVVGPQPDAAMEVIEKVARDKDVQMSRFGAEWSIADTGNGMRFVSAAKVLDLPYTNLPGEHQVMNSGQAIAAILALIDQGFDISDENIQVGLTQVEWPARLQKLKQGPILDQLGDKFEVWLDGGHNAAAGETLAKQAAAWEDADTRPLYIIFGMLNTKAAGDFLRPLAPYVSKAYALAIPGEENSLSANEAQQFATEQGINCDAVINVDWAINMLPKDQDARLLICGSLYFAGVILADNQ